MTKISKEELFWRLYVNEREFLRHYDIQQTSISNLVLVASSAVLALVLGKEYDGSQSAFGGLVLFFLGTIGFIHSRKFYVEVLRHAERSHEYLRICACEVSNETVSDIEAIKENVNKKISAGYPIINSFKLNMVWRIYHGTLAFAGILLLMHGIYFWMYHTG
ncbi:hypothetical protein MUU53_12165 [Rhizobium lemnae]|uniref:SMODS and SLOG-associating 2TM effector domain-containing protein n=1 Tax=Rhizobium lemnae TaxID=1214924 RepID=A0ABV8EDT9_9HYPH|nr:hypothetical protein [Rhizobium lemnae]MCJ8508667.1 hypothetical protein [Rhizobium lemnae]